MQLVDWLLICSTLLAPLFAVQAQKYMERFRENEGRRLWVFKTLMATQRSLDFSLLYKLPRILPWPGTFYLSYESILVRST